MKNNALFRLIKSLSKSEKRYFRLFSNRTMEQKERKFLLLFDLLDKQKTYNEAKVIAKLPGKTSKAQLANIKRHLYKQILTSLRLINTSKQLEFEIREQIDFANILYNKGMYMDSLHLLERIKNIARDNHQDILQIEIIHFQKLIESRHITRSRRVGKKLENLLEESEKKSRMAQASSALVSFNIKIHGFYIVHGFAQTKDDIKALDEAWNELKPKAYYTEYEDTFFEKAHRIQARMWYRYILLNFSRALKHAKRVIAHFDKHEQMKSFDPNFYIRSLYYQSVFYFLLKDAVGYKKTLEEMNNHILKTKADYSPIHHQVAFVYQNLGQLNYWLLLKNFSKANDCGDKISNKLSHFKNNIDAHRVLLFNYKFATITFALKKYDRALDYLRPLLHHRENILRKEMDINARLLELMCLYETKTFDLMESRLAALGRSLSKVAKPARLQHATKHLMRDLIKVRHPEQEKALLEKHIAIFNAYKDQPREQLFLSYLDVLGWIEEK